MAKKSNHYIDNEEFLTRMITFRDGVIDAKEKNEPRPRIPDYLGECFIKIATHLSYKPNFINYTFRDDMISDGVENCLQYIDNFDPAKSKNPFAYFTQIIYYAFLRRIQKEKKQLYVKYRAIERSGLMDQLVQHDALGERTGGIQQPTLYENMQEFITSFEEGIKKQRQKAAKKRGLEKFEKDSDS
jgi:hypothetical protein